MANCVAYFIIPRIHVYMYAEILLQEVESDPALAGRTLFLRP